MGSFDLGVARGRIELDSSGLQRGLRDAEGQVDGFVQKMDRAGASLQRWGAGLTATVTAPIIYAFSKATDMAASHQDALNRLNHTLGPLAAETEAWADTLLETHGIGKRMATDMVGRFADMLIAQGKTAVEANELAKEYTRLAGDVASFYDLPHEEVQTIIMAGLRGEYQSLERVGVFIKEADVQKRALLDTGKQSVAQLTEEEKARARQALIVEQLGRVEGDYARTRGDVNNQQREAQQRVDNLATDIGTKLIPVKQKLLVIADKVLTVFEKLGPAGQTLALVLAALAAAVGPVLLVFGTFLRGLSKIITDGPKVASALGKAALKFGELAAAAGRAALSVGRAAVKMVVDAARATGRVVASIGRQIAAWALLGAKALLHAAKVALAWLIALGPIALIVAAVIAAVALIIANWEKIGPFLSKLWDGIKKAAAFAWGWLKAKVSQIVGAIVDWIREKFTAIRDFLRETWDRIKENVKNGARAVIDFVREIPGKVREFFADAGRWLIESGKDILRGLWNGIKSMAGWLKDQLIRLVRNIIPGPVADLLGISSPSKLFAEYGRNLIEGLVRGLRRAAPMLGPALTDALSGLTAHPVLTARPAVGGTAGAGGNVTMGGIRVGQIVVNGGEPGRARDEVLDALEAYSRQLIDAARAGRR